VRSNKFVDFAACFGQTAFIEIAEASLVCDSALSPPPSSFGVDLARLTEPRFFYPKSC